MPRRIKNFRLKFYDAANFVSCFMPIEACIAKTGDSIDAPYEAWFLFPSNNLRHAGLCIKSRYVNQQRA